MRSLGRLVLVSMAAALVAVGAFSSTVAAASEHRGELHVTKECSAYTGQAGSYCTFTSSNLEAIAVGSRLVYASAAGATGLDTDVTIVGRHGTSASGHCLLDFATGVGACSFWHGTGRLAGFHASVAVSYLGGPNWAWDGTYRFDHHGSGTVAARDTLVPKHGGRRRAPEPDRLPS